MIASSLVREQSIEVRAFEKGDIKARKEIALELISEGVYSIESIARIAKVTTEQVLAWQREAQK